MKRRTETQVPCTNCSQFLGAINALAARMGPEGEFRFACGFCGSELMVRWNPGGPELELADASNATWTTLSGVTPAAYQSVAYPQPGVNP